MEFAQTSTISEFYGFCIGFDFDHITAVDMLFCSNLRNFIKIGPPLAERKSRYFKTADLSHLGFYGSNNGFFEKPMYDFP